MINRIALWATAVSAGAVALSTVALAADMPVKAPPADVAAVYSWTGFYLGGNIGGAWSRNRQSEGQLINTAPPSTLSPVLPFDTNGSGFIGGVQFGYNWQFAPAWIVGIEADLSWTGLKGSQTYNPIPPGQFGVAPPSFITMSRDVQWLGSVRGRFGHAWERTLLYLTGGVAWGHVRFDGNASRGGGAIVDPASVSSTKTGWVVGGGIEHMLPRNWTIRAQYLYYNIPGVSAVGPDSLAAGGAFATYSWGRTQVHALTAGLNYKFDWGTVVARY